MKLKVFFLRRIFELIVLIILPLMFFSCNGSGSSESKTSDTITGKMSTVSGKLNDTVSPIKTDTIFALAPLTTEDSLDYKKRSVSVFTAKWPLDDFISKLDKADTIRFEFLSLHSNWIAGGKVLDHSQGRYMPVRLNPNSVAPIIINSTGGTDGFWLRESRLSPQEIRDDIITKVVKERGFEDILTNPSNYNIIIIPRLAEQEYKGVTTQYVGLTMRIEDRNHARISSVARATNPCPVCN